jgi:CRP/FNR family transcriptional regulator, cyclic AMP receptor protein
VLIRRHFGAEYAARCKSTPLVPNAHTAPESPRASFATPALVCYKEALALAMHMAALQRTPTTAALHSARDTATPAHLKKIPVLASLRPKDLKTIAPLFVLSSCTIGTIVSHEGRQPEYVNFVLAGRAQGFWRDQAGMELKLGVFGPGDHFPQVVLAGEAALVSHVAISDVLMASIRIDDLMRLLESHPQIAVLLLAEVVASFRRLLRRTKMLTMEGVYGRVVDLLFAGTAELDNHHFAPLTHAEIGRRVGATREMVGRILRDLARGGYIETQRGRLRILRKPPARW